MQDLPEEEREKTLTLKRDKSIAKDQKKLDEMKKKLHTDDECESGKMLSSALSAAQLGCLCPRVSKGRFFFAPHKISADKKSFDL